MTAVLPGAYTTDRMVNTLACADRVVSVANVDLGHNRAHVSSSRGPTRDGRCKPEIGADGTAVLAACGRAPRTGPEPRDSGGVDLAQARAAALAEGERFMASLADAVEIIASTDPSKVTPPNHASITLLAEEDGPGAC